MADESTGGTGTPPAGDAATGGTPPAAETQVVGQESTLLSDGTKGDAPAGEGKEPQAPTPFDLKDFTPPEGLELSDKDKETLGGIATKHGLSKEAMSELLGEYATRVKTVQDAAVQAYLDTNKQWQDEVRADPEIGGEKLDGVLKTIGAVINDPAIAAPGFKEALNLTGAGNNPAVIKTIYKMAQKLTEGGHVGGSPPAEKPGPKRGASAMYPNLPTGG